MNSALASAASTPLLQPKSLAIRPSNLKLTPIRAQSAQNNSPNKTQLAQKLKRAAGVVILTSAIFSQFGQRGQRHALAEAEPPMLTPATSTLVEEADKDGLVGQSPLSKLIESSPEAINVLKMLLVEKLDNKEDDVALKLLDQLIAAQPEEIEWKYMKARLLNEMNMTDESRVLYEELLVIDPLNYETLFENALLMNRRKEGEAVIARLEEAVRVAEVEGKGLKEGRDLKLMIAQMRFLQGNMDEALGDYDRLSKEDGKDFRVYYSKGMVYSLLKMKEEAQEEFEKYRKLGVDKKEVEAFLKTPLSRMLIFGSSKKSE